MSHTASGYGPWLRAEGLIAELSATEGAAV
jgi:hypothetical protein